MFAISSADEFFVIHLLPCCISAGRS